MQLPFRATLTAASLLSTGCYSHRLLTYGQPGNVSTFHRTVNAGWAGHSGSGVPPPGAADSQSCHNQIDRNGMHMVTVSSNLGYAALTVVTLGAVSPADVRWTCAPNPSVSGPTPSGRGPGGGGSAALPTTAAFTGRTLTSSVWGVLQSDAKAPDNPPPGRAAPPGPPTPANCNDRGMRQAKTGISPLNYFYSLATLATAGFVSPLHVAWQCEEDAHGSR